MVMSVYDFPRRRYTYQVDGIEIYMDRSLCIIQDDTIDWQIKSSKMAVIYENSYVTISANNFTGMLLGPPALRESHSV
jgi:Heterokaryon incompatibility protein (HET)